MNFKNDKVEIMLEDLRMGEQFEYKETIYTKLDSRDFDNTSMCLLDKYSALVPEWSKNMPFDSKNVPSNNYKESTIREYINGVYFQESVLNLCAGQQNIELLNDVNYKYYKDYINKSSDFDSFWLCTIDREGSNTTAMQVDSSGSASRGYVSLSYGVRPVIYFSNNIIVHPISSDKESKNIKLEQLQQELEKMRQEIEKLKNEQGDWLND